MGVVKAKDLLSRCLAGEPIDLMASAQKPLFVPESVRVWKLLELFKQTGNHIALVIDEYGGTHGLATPTDILEAIVGEIPSVVELAEPQAVQREDGSWLIDGMLPVSAGCSIGRALSPTRLRTGNEPVLQASIVTLTMNPAVDVSSSVDHVVPERKLRCATPRYEPGGGGINVSRAIHTLGGDSLALYLRGGLTGQLLEKLLEQEGLDQRVSPIEGMTRESIAIFEEATGVQYRFIMPGPTLREEEWQQCLDVLSALAPRPAYIVASGGLPPGAPEDFYARIARAGKSIGARVIVDTSGAGLAAAVREGVYLIKPNLNEFGQLIGSGIEDECRLEAAVRAIVAAGQSEFVVVSLGRAGALLGSRDGCERLRAPTVPIQSKVGAGDSMVAGIVLSLARGESLQDAARFGVAAGTAAVMTPGTELCRREDTERLYKVIANGR